MSTYKTEIKRNINYNTKKAQSLHLKTKAERKERWRSWVYWKLKITRNNKIIQWIKNKNNSTDKRTISINAGRAETHYWRLYVKFLSSPVCFQKWSNRTKEWNRSATIGVRERQCRTFRQPQRLHETPCSLFVSDEKNFFIWTNVCSECMNTLTLQRSTLSNQIAAVARTPSTVPAITPFLWLFFTVSCFRILIVIFSISPRLCWRSLICRSSSHLTICLRKPARFLGSLWNCSTSWTARRTSRTSDGARNTISRRSPSRTPLTSRPSCCPSISSIPTSARSWDSWTFTASKSSSSGTGRCSCTSVSAPTCRSYCRRSAGAKTAWRGRAGVLVSGCWPESAPTTSWHSRPKPLSTPSCRRWNATSSHRQRSSKHRTPRAKRWSLPCTRYEHLSTRPFSLPHPSIASGAAPVQRHRKPHWRRHPCRVRRYETRSRSLADACWSSWQHAVGDSSMMNSNTSYRGRSGGTRASEDGGKC